MKGVAFGKIDSTTGRSIGNRPIEYTERETPKELDK